MKTVLLVEDDELFREAVTVILENRYRILTASSGTEALDVISGDKPDLIVLDVMLDHLSEGFDIARKIKTDERTKDIPIIMLTGVDKVYNIRMEVDESWVPYDRYLEKPVKPEVLLEHINELIGEKH